MSLQDEQKAQAINLLYLLARSAEQQPDMKGDEAYPTLLEDLAFASVGLDPPSGRFLGEANGDILASRDKYFEQK